MVATRLSLLSMAAVSSGMFGLSHGEGRAGRVERRLPQFRGAVPAVLATPNAQPTPASVSAHPLTATQSSQTQTWTDYPYPPDFAEGTVHMGTEPWPTSSTQRPSRTPVPGRAGDSVDEEDVPEPTAPGVMLAQFVVSTVRDTLGLPGTWDTLVDDASPVPTRSPSDDAPDSDEPHESDGSSRPVSNPLTKPNRTSIFLPGTTGNYVTPTLASLDRPTANFTLTGVWSTASISTCNEFENLKPSTSYSIVYTETVTWTEDPALYTPVFEPETTPEPSCLNLNTPTPVRMTLSRCQRTGPGPSETVCETSMSTTTMGASVVPLFSSAAPAAPTTTILVTAKHPTVVFPPMSTPQYNGVPTKGQNPHDAPTTGAPPGRNPPDYGGGSGQAQGPGALPQLYAPVTVAVQPNGVVIGGQTFSDDPMAPTRVLTVDGNQFTINPTEVIGVGATLNRPAAVGGAFVPTPTSTNIAGLSVFLSGSVAVIDGTTFSIPMTATTVMVKGQTVSMGPNGVAIASRTIPVNVSPVPTQIFIAGGELVTALGQSVIVIGSKTLTYGGASSVTDIDGDKITLGPAAITVHGSTIGGDKAKSGDTTYEIVGGATLTEIGPSVVVIADITYTVGPGTGTTTTVVGGERITVAPTGVSVGTLTLRYPFGPTTVLTPTPGGTASAAVASPTSNGAGHAVRRDWILSLFLTCTAIGVRVFGFLL